MDKENGAHEEFDNPIAQNAFEGLGFGENDHVKTAEKQDKKQDIGQHEKKLNKEDQELQNDVLLEENEEDGKDVKAFGITDFSQSIYSKPKKSLMLTRSDIF